MPALGKTTLLFAIPEPLKSEYTWIIETFNQAHPEYQIDTISIRQRHLAHFVSCRAFEQEAEGFKELEALESQPWIHTYPAYTLIPFQHNRLGHIFCLPMQLNTYGMFYHKAIFKALNLPPPDDIHILEKHLSKIRQSGIHFPIAYQNLVEVIGPGLWHGASGYQLWLKDQEAFIRQFAPALTELTQTLTTYRQFPSDPISALKTQKIAILMGPMHLMQHFDASEIGIFPPPKIEAREKCYMNQYAQLGVGLRAQALNKDKAITFLKWLASREVAQAIFTQKKGYLPATQYALQPSDTQQDNLYRWINRCEPSFLLSQKHLTQSTKLTDRQSLDAPETAQDQKALHMRKPAMQAESTQSKQLIQPEPTPRFIEKQGSTTNGIFKHKANRADNTTPEAETLPPEGAAPHVPQAPQNPESMIQEKQINQPATPQQAPQPTAPEEDFPIQEHPQATLAKE